MRGPVRVGLTRRLIIFGLKVFCLFTHATAPPTVLTPTNAQIRKLVFPNPHVAHPPAYFGISGHVPATPPVKFSCVVQASSPQLSLRISCVVPAMSLQLPFIFCLVQATSPQLSLCVVQATPPHILCCPGRAPATFRVYLMFCWPLPRKVP